MRTINTLAELKEERQRLYMRQAFLETEIKTNFNEMKEQLKPVHHLAQTAGKFLSSKDNSVVGDSVGFITNALVKNVILKNAGFITKLIVPYLAKNVASNVAEDNKPKIAGWISDMIAKFMPKKVEAEA
ncbi:MAG: hypothetical protein JWO09_2231 [Bacteroidetes bacterium]|nr:hypothetical protein [Bacteroidota bacterium]